MSESTVGRKECSGEREREGRGGGRSGGQGILGRAAEARGGDLPHRLGDLWINGLGHGYCPDDTLR